MKASKGNGSIRPILASTGMLEAALEADAGAPDALRRQREGRQQEDLADLLEWDGGNEDDGRPYTTFTK
jgi:hypothetical protein